MCAKGVAVDMRLSDVCTPTSPCTHIKGRWPPLRSLIFREELRRAARTASVDGRASGVVLDSVMARCHGV